MSNAVTVFKERKLALEFNEATVKVLYHRYSGVDLNSTVVFFHEKRRVLSTIDGFRNVGCVANVFIPKNLENQVMTIGQYDTFIKHLPATLGLASDDVTFLSTGVDMDKVAFSERSYDDFHVCCIATGGALNNALRTGVDEGKWVEKDMGFKLQSGTINLILLTNVAFSDGAMARAIITATEAKTAALQDLNYMSTATPSISATGTGTDSMVVVSGVNPDLIIRHTGGHTKIGELIGFTAKKAVEEALKKFDVVKNNSVK